MRLWRVSARGTFDGEGAKRAGGRWNRPGTPVVYAAATLALATLEFLVHAAQDITTAHVVAHYADVPDDTAIEQVSAAHLPDGWQRYPGPERLQDLGSRWAASASTLVLSVPSAVLPVAPGLVPDERNYLLNPLHPAFSRVEVRSVKVSLDPRLWA